jgi:hypothetical protein
MIDKIFVDTNVCERTSEQNRKRRRIQPFQKLHIVKRPYIRQRKKTRKYINVFVFPGPFYSSLPLSGFLIG